MKGDGTGLSDSDWTTFEYILPAPADATSLAFSEWSNPDSFGVFLDGVRVEAIRDETA